LKKYVNIHLTHNYYNSLSACSINTWALYKIKIILHRKHHNLHTSILSYNIRISKVILYRYGSYYVIIYYLLVRENHALYSCSALQRFRSIADKINIRSLLTLAHNDIIFISKNYAGTRLDVQRLYAYTYCYYYTGDWRYFFLQGRSVTTLFIHRELQGTWTFGIRRLLPLLQCCGGVVYTVYIIIYIYLLYKIIIIIVIKTKQSRHKNVLAWDFTIFPSNSGDKFTSSSYNTHGPRGRRVYQCE